MKLEWKFQKPDMVQEAAKTGGKNVFLEILIFLGVFFVTQSAMSIPISVVMIPMMFTSEGYLEAAASGDYNRIMEASMEIASSNIMLLTQLFATIIMVVLPILFCKLIQKREARTLGFKKSGMWMEYLKGAFIGLRLMAVIVLVAVLTGAMKLSFNSDMLSLGSIIMLLAIFVGFLIQGMSEEVLCRGYFLVSIARKDGKVWLGIIVSSIAFGALHLGNMGIAPLAFVNLILFGIYAGVYFIKTGNIWGVAAIHSIWNFAQGNIFGVLVSGMDFGTTIFNATINEEMALINGGSFGLEGGILTTIVLVLEILFTLCMKQKDVAVEEATVTEETAEFVDISYCNDIIN